MSQQAEPRQPPALTHLLPSYMDPRASISILKTAVMELGGVSHHPQGWEENWGPARAVTSLPALSFVLRRVASSLKPHVLNEPSFSSGEMLVKSQTPTATQPAEPLTGRGGGAALAQLPASVPLKCPSPGPPTGTRAAPAKARSAFRCRN